MSKTGKVKIEDENYQIPVKHGVHILLDEVHSSEGSGGKRYYYISPDRATAQMICRILAQQYYKADEI
ncbi:MAG: hypothetical protein HW401_412 [Parcubacteria group bacterium]|nr:hypothetical protein [Parcubacteria group bacterium]